MNIQYSMYAGENQIAALDAAQRLRHGIEASARTGRQDSPNSPALPRVMRIREFEFDFVFFGFGLDLITSSPNHLKIWTIRGANSFGLRNVITARKCGHNSKTVVSIRMDPEL